MEIIDDFIEDKTLPWEEMYFGDGAFAQRTKCHDMFAGGADGKLQLLKVYEQDDYYYDHHYYDSDYSNDDNYDDNYYDDEDPDIPCFLVVKETRYEHLT